MNETLEDNNAVGRKILQYCGSLDKKTDSTEAVSVKLHKGLRQDADKLPNYSNTVAVG